MSFDLKRTYFSVMAFVVLMVVFFAGLGLLSAGSTVAFLSTTPFEERQAPGYTSRTGATEDTELRIAKEEVATSLAVMLLALPVWYFHWRRYRQLAHENQAFLLYEVYGYTLMAIALITMVVAGGIVLAQVFRAIMGVLDLSSKYAQLKMGHEVVGMFLIVGWAFVFWYYHWRNMETVSERQ